MQYRSKGVFVFIKLEKRKEMDIGRPCFVNSIYPKMHYGYEQRYVKTKVQNFDDDWDLSSGLQRWEGEEFKHY